MTVPPALLTFLKQAWPYLLCLLLGVLWARSCADTKASEQHVTSLLSQMKQEDDSIKVLASRDTVTLQAIHDTIPKIITKIRTVVLAPVDSAWAKADKAIALVPASDSACHLAYDGLKSGCEILRAQVVKDTATFAWIRDSSEAVKQREVQQATLAGKASAKVDTVVKEKSCKVLFFPCPSRSLIGGLGTLLGLGIGLKVH